MELIRAIFIDAQCIAAGVDPHAGALHSVDCGQRRGWLSKTTAQWIEHVATRFGAPTTPIVVRKVHTFQEEAPPTEPELALNSN